MSSGRVLLDEWRGTLADYLQDRMKVHLFCTGNPLRSDDAVGIYIVDMLRRKYGRRLPGKVVLHRYSPSPEYEMSRVDGEDGIVVFDALDAGGEPGSIVCARLSDTRYSFFATHNMPLRLIPSLSTRTDSILIVGVQPANMEVGYELTPRVRVAADYIVDAVAEMEGVI